MPRLQADIADVVARLEPPHSTAADATDADQHLLALMPQPIVVLPMLPADQKMIEFVAQVAQSLASQAAMARAAQARYLARRGRSRGSLKYQGGQMLGGFLRFGIFPFSRMKISKQSAQLAVLAL